jgi:hypothetical protein
MLCHQGYLQLNLSVRRRGRGGALIDAYPPSKDFATRSFDHVLRTRRPPTTILSKMTTYVFEMKSRI